ncbi:MAG: nucleoside hydrolase [Candidatus Latescibacteria bacterium]|nr:nucleoside hydrolase [Candidatus Latescibacterota bacterium]
MSMRIILDTDTGVDDALAILLAMRSPELTVEAITAVSGNVHVDHCVRNILMTLELLELESIPAVARGEDGPLASAVTLADNVHADDGLGGVSKLLLADGQPRYSAPQNRLSPTHAVDLILEIIERHPGEITLIAVGPLTNVARAVINNPFRMQKLKQLIVMGGAFQVYGNVSPVAEFNIFADPHAAQVVCGAGIPMVFVPLDVTMQAVLSAPDIDLYAQQGGKVARFVKDCTDHYVDFHRQRRNVDGCFIHDALAVAVAFQPELVTMVDAKINVETAGDLTSGMTVADLRPAFMPDEGPNGKVCTQVKADTFISLFNERVLK